MIKNGWYRRIHRFVAVAFTASVVLVSIVLATQEQPAEWVYLSPLLPLGLLLLTGAVLFLQPYAARRRRSERTSANTMTT